jgi:hypothetical protein
MAKSQSGSPLRSAEGKRTMPGPGKKSLFFVIANSAKFCHCEERGDESILKRAA